jgi:aldehyde:ferredoxin oxidoreductase
MRNYLHINLDDRTIESEELAGEALARAGRHFIVKSLLEAGAAKVDPLSPENPLIFSAGPFAGTNFSNANRLSVGCKSPLTGGVKEANSGGTFAFALGQIELAGLTLHGASDEWVVIRIPKDGEITFEDAAPYMGKGNIEAAALLHEKYGDKVSLALCGPVGEYQGLMAGIAFSDPEGRPERLAARGGVGAVMGAKKVKAIVVDKHKMPTFHDRRKVMGSVKGYNAKLEADPSIENYAKLGTAMMADVMNHVGGIPVRNFSSGQLVDTEVETMKLGGEHIQSCARRPHRARLHARLHDQMLQRLCRRERRGDRLAAGIRDHRADGHQLRVDRPGRPGAAERSRQRSWHRHHRDRRHAGGTDGGRTGEVR